MSLFRTVGARLSLALLAVVAIALTLVYVVVVPSLENRLIGARLDDLSRAARQLKYDQSDQDFFTNAAATSNARVLLFEVLSQTPPTAVPTDTSLPGQSAAPYTNDPITLEAARTGHLARGTVTHEDGRFAEVAVPAGGGNILLLSSPLHDALADVSAVQRRLLFSGVLALAVALAIGYVAARFFARRIRRLEQAAERIAAGRFDEPVADSSPDELGQLSRAFDRMRIRLARLEHARREFVANASHELRTPLFSLGGFLELLEDEDLDEQTRREFLETMSDQVRRLTKLAEDLLDLSRLDAGRLHVKTEELDLANVAEAAVSEFAGVAKSTEHPLALAKNGPATAVGDQQRALQIVRILVENAIVHTPKGTPVHVAAHADGEARVTVADEGPGVPEADRAELFDRFYRGTSTKASGSGLGLAIARELAQLMGGRIELESDSGGTTFSFVLPRERFPVKSPLAGQGDD